MGYYEAETKTNQGKEEIEAHGKQVLEEISRSPVATTGNNDDALLDDYNLPEEILRMDAAAIKLFKKLLAEGEEKVYNIRVMIVGHFGVGKTVLTKRLLDQHQHIDISTRIPTEGIDVHVGQMTVNHGDGIWTPQTLDATDRLIERKRQIISEQPRKNTDDSSDYSEQKSPEKKSPTSDDGDNVSKRDVVSQQTTIYDRSEQKSQTELQESLEEENQQEQPGTSYIEIETNHQIDSNISNKIDVEILGEISKMRQLKRRNNADLSIWDFAGQYAFYDTHQVFMSWRTIYLLVTDLSKEPTDIVTEDDCYVDSIGRKQLTVLEFVEFWLNAIHECSRKDTKSTDEKQESSESDKDNNSPPVILVGTFADKLKDKTVAAHRLEKIEEMLNKRTASQVVGRHVIDNTSETGGFAELRKTINDKANKQNYWGESKPAKWIQAEVELHRKKKEGVKILKKEEIKQILKEIIKNDEELEVFLEFHHACGNLIHFKNEKTLNKTIILDPKWLIDAFKSLNTHCRFSTKSHEIMAEWDDFEKYGSLPKSLIDEFWGEKLSSKDKLEYAGLNDDDEQFSKYSETILDYLVKLGLLAECKYSDTKIKQKVYIAPSFLKETISEELLMPAYNETTTSKLCFTAKSGFLPSSVFNKLLASCIAKYSLVYDDTTSRYLLFCGCGQFRIFKENLDPGYTLFVFFRKNEIQIWLSVKDYKPDDEKSVREVCTELKTFVENIIKPIDVELNLKCPQTSFILSDEFRLKLSYNTTEQTKEIESKITVIPFQWKKFWLSTNQTNNSSHKKPEIEKGFKKDCKYNGRLIKLSDDEKKTIANSCGGNSAFQVLWKIQALQLEGCPIKLAIRSIGDLKNPENEKYVQRKIKASSFRHPFILPIYSIFEWKHRFYFVSPYCENGDLESRLRCKHDIRTTCNCKKLNLAQKIRIAFQVALAIHYLHTPFIYDPNRGSKKTVTVHGSISSKYIVLDGNLNARLIEFKHSHEYNEVTESVSGSDEHEVTESVSGSDEQNISTQSTVAKTKGKTRDIKKDYDSFEKVFAELMEGCVITEGMDEKLKEWYNELLAIRTAIREVNTADDFKQKVVDKLKNLLCKTFNVDLMVRPKVNHERKCDVCMINQADKKYFENHLKECKQAMEICSACNYNSHRISQMCYSCGATVKPFLGERWGALLVAGEGSEEDKTQAETFQRDVDAIKRVIESGSLPIAEENVETIISVGTEFLPNLRKSIVNIKEKSVPPSTMLIYFSCHGEHIMPKTDQQTGESNRTCDSNQTIDNASSDGLQEKHRFLVGSNGITLNSLTEELETMEHVETFVIILDRCYAPDIKINRKTVIQINSCQPSEKAEATKEQSSFTKFLVQALEGKSCNIICEICKNSTIRLNDYISVADLLEYIQKHLPPKQNPRLRFEGTNLHIAYIVRKDLECYIPDLEESLTKLNTN